MNLKLTADLASQRLDALPPRAAGDIAYRIFCTPTLSEWRAPGHRRLAERARFHLRAARWQRVATPVGELQAYVFEPDAEVPVGTVLVVHGWTSEASFMTALAEPIRRAGFRVVLFDQPAHGRSPGNRTNMMDCAKATLAIGDRFGPIAGIVAHSFGGMVALMAAEGRSPLSHALPLAKIVLIACPNRLVDVTRAFAARRNMSAAASMAFESRLRRVGHRSIKSVASADMLQAVGCSALVVHARDDADVPFTCAEETAAAHPEARLAAFDGFGHRNILYAPPVIRAVVKHLAQP